MPMRRLIAVLNQARGWFPFTLGGLLLLSGAVGALIVLGGSIKTTVHCCWGRWGLPFTDRAAEHGCGGLGGLVVIAKVGA